MHQQPPKTPLFASTSFANASQLDSSRASILYPDPTTAQPSPLGRMALVWAQCSGMTPAERVPWTLTLRALLVPPMIRAQRGLGYVRDAYFTLANGQSDSSHELTAR